MSKITEARKITHAKITTFTVFGPLLMGCCYYMRAGHLFLKSM